MLEVSNPDENTHTQIQTQKPDRRTQLDNLVSQLCLALATVASAGNNSNHTDCYMILA